MFDWWLVRLADKTGKLTAHEWESLTVAGHKLTIPPHREATWTANKGGVIIVSQGAVTLHIRETQSQHILKLHSGDMTGTLQPVVCRIEATRTALVHYFTHQEWLAALKKMPAITHKLLNGMAASALQIEETLSERV